MLISIAYYTRRGSNIFLLLHHHMSLHVLACFLARLGLAYQALRACIYAHMAFSHLAPHARDYKILLLRQLIDYFAIRTITE